MTVAHLIAWLQKQPQDAMVGHWSYHFIDFHSAHFEMGTGADEDGNDVPEAHVILSTYPIPDWDKEPEP